MRKVYVIFALVALTSFLLAGSVFSAVTGKLNGTVRLVKSVTKSSIIADSAQDIALKSLSNFAALSSSLVRTGV